MSTTLQTEIRPFHVDILEEQIDNLRRRIAATRWPRAFGATAAQNEERKTHRLPMPVLAMGGGESSGAMVAETMKLAADDVQGLVIPGIGHWLAEQAPDEIVAALTEFLARYRDGPAAAADPGEHPAAVH